MVLIVRLNLIHQTDAFLFWPLFWFLSSLNRLNALNIRASALQSPDTETLT